MIGERIKQIRKATGNTQQSFADSIGLKRNTIATYEMGQTQPSDRTIGDICREFKVSETWLRTGEGEMFIPITEDEKLLEVLADLQVDETNPIRDLLVCYWQLEEDEKKVIKKLLRKMLGKEKTGQ